jgi:dTDP-4-dehydrorhamnose 3,5-epimerase
MKIITDEIFDNINNNKFEANAVLQIFPNVFKDQRGYFTEVLKEHINEYVKDKIEIPLWLTSITWIKQINRSLSTSYTIRGCHAQKAPYCQGKLVEAINTKIYDIITDARPDSKTFGVSNIYVLDPNVQNKLWVPRGFLHSFAVPNIDEDKAIFQYFCDNVYDKESEICINPLSLLPKIVDEADIDVQLFDIFNQEELSISEKDKNGLNYETWMNEIKTEYEKTGKVWYK